NLNGYNAVQNVGNQVIQNVVQNPRVQNQIGNGNLVAVRVEGNAAGHNGNQIRCYNCMGYTEILKPIPELQQVPQNDNNVISEVTGV
nr:hypothetical protein [Tanacetum cinerariifolium]